MRNHEALSLGRSYPDTYTKQHQTTRLQSSYEGPFKIVDRPSKSTVKLVVGHYKSGAERFEIRHANDLKFAHPESMAAPAERPALGRPATVRKDVRIHTDAPSTDLLPPPQLINQSDPEPPPPAQPVVDDAGKQTKQNNPNSNVGGRPTRTTRNPNPYYVDAMSWSPQPWSASQTEVDALNKSISLSRHEALTGW